LSATSSATSQLRRRATLSNTDTATLQQTLNNKKTMTTSKRIEKQAAHHATKRVTIPLAGKSPCPPPRIPLPSRYTPFVRGKKSSLAKEACTDVSPSGVNTGPVKRDKHWISQAA